MANYLASRKIHSQTWKENDVIRFPIPMGFVYQSYNIELFARSQSGATGTGSQDSQGLSKLIKRVRLIVNDNSELIDLSGYGAFLRCEHDNRMIDSGFGQLANGDNDDVTGCVSIPIDRRLRVGGAFMVSGDDFRMSQNFNQFNKVEMEITIGEAGDIWADAGNDATIASAGAGIVIHAERYEQPNLIYPSAQRLSARYLKETRHAVVEDGVLEFDLPRREGRAYVSELMTMRADELSYLFPPASLINLSHGQDDIYEDVSVCMMQKLAMRHNTLPRSEKTIDILFPHDRRADGIIVPSIRQEVMKLTIPVEFKAGTTKQELIRISETYEPI